MRVSEHLIRLFSSVHFCKLKGPCVRVFMNYCARMSVSDEFVFCVKENLWTCVWKYLSQQLQYVLTIWLRVCVCVHM